MLKMMIAAAPMTVARPAFAQSQTIPPTRQNGKHAGRQLAEQSAAPSSQKMRGLRRAPYRADSRTSRGRTFAGLVSFA